MADTDRVVVIGAGLNGLVAGCLLSRQKTSVVILDQRPLAGGAAVTTEFAPGFRAPTLGHALGPVDARVFAALGLDVSACGFIRPDPWLTTLGDDGRDVTFSANVGHTQQSIATVSAGDGERWPAFLDTVRRVAGVLDAVHGEPPPDLDAPAGSDWWQLLRFGGRARRLGRRDLARLARWMTMPVADLTDEWFDSDLVRAAIAAHGIFGNPVGPRSAGTGAMLLSRIAADPSPVGSGVTCAGGPGAFASRLAELAQQQGAKIRLGVRVTRIAVDDSRVRGVVLEDGSTIEADTVVAAIDPRQALLGLLGPTDLPPSMREDVRHYRMRGVTAKVNLAVDRLPGRLLHGGDTRPIAGRFLIAPSLDHLERAHDAGKYGRCSPEPWLDVAVPTLHDPSLAPNGAHVLSVVVHVMPFHLKNGDWATQADALYESVLSTLDARLPGIRTLVVGREVITPVDLETRWGLTGGHIFHGESALDQWWIGRPLPALARYRTPVRGLVLASAGTHPGGGLTGLPGLLAAKTVGNV